MAFSAGSRLKAVPEPRCTNRPGRSACAGIGIDLDVDRLPGPHVGELGLLVVGGRPTPRRARTSSGSGRRSRTSPLAAESLTTRPDCAATTLCIVRLIGLIELRLRLIELRLGALVLRLERLDSRSAGSPPSLRAPTRPAAPGGRSGSAADAARSLPPSLPGPGRSASSLAAKWSWAWVCSSCAPGLRRPARSGFRAEASMFVDVGLARHATCAFGLIDRDLYSRARRYGRASHRRLTCWLSVTGTSSDIAANLGRHREAAGRNERIVRAFVVPGLEPVHDAANRSRNQRTHDNGGHDPDAVSGGRGTKACWQTRRAAPPGLRWRASGPVAQAIAAVPQRSSRLGLGIHVDSSACRWRAPGGDCGW